ncbi:MAG: hypothetical protein AAF694_22690 [Bacteroidota bacterium]
MTITTKKSFLTEEVLPLLNTLKADTQPAFGLMTAQHMVEHLTWVTKSSSKRNGEPAGEPTQRQLGFKRFIEQGAIFEHRPSDKTKADLPPLKYGSLTEALEQIPVAIERFYSLFENNPGFKSYTSFTGELSFEELELMHYQHFRYHMWQFGLVEQYP